MKHFTLTLQDEERHYVAHFDEVIYYEIEYPGLNYFLIIVEKDSESRIEIPIPYDVEASIITVLMSEETDFEEKVYDDLTEKVDQIFGDFFASDENVLSGNEIIAALAPILEQDAVESYKRYIEKDKS